MTDQGNGFAEPPIGVPPWMAADTRRPQSSTAIHYLDRGARPETTERTYNWGQRRFLSWCAETGQSALPADPRTVQRFLLQAADRDNLAANSLCVLCAAIARAHRDHGLADPTTDPAVRALLAEIRAVHPPSQTPAATLRIVAQMVESAHKSARTWKQKIAARRDTALLWLGFAAALRRSELAALLVGDLTVEAGPDGGEPLLRLRIHRRQGARAENIPAFIRRGRHDGLRCPWCAVQRWLDIVAVCDHAAATEHHRQRRASISDPLAIEDAVAVAAHRFARSDTVAIRAHRCEDAWPDIADAAAPLFRPVNNGGFPRPTALSGRSVGRILDKRSRAAGVEVMRAHSLRAGTAAEAFDRGASAQDVQALGRWKHPDTALRYNRTREPHDTHVDLGL